MSITKQDADAIASKLKATVQKKGKAHDLAQIIHNGKIIAQFGIRRGSRKDAGHGHIPRDIYLNHKKCSDLASCTFSRDAWLQNMADKGLLA